MRQCLVSSILALILSIHGYSGINLPVITLLLVFIFTLVLSVRYLMTSKMLVVCLMIASFLVTFGYSQYWLEDQLSSRLPKALSPIVLNGVAKVVDCEQPSSEVEKLRLELLSVASGNSQLQRLKNITVNHYLAKRGFRGGSNTETDSNLKSPVGCHKIIKFSAKLRAPYSFINPYGFDYEAWQLSRGVDASGYLLGYDVQSVDRSLEAKLIEFRQEGIARAAALPGKAGQIVPALLFGESGYLNKKAWLDFQMTGTVHLLIVSGLHVSFLILLVMLIWRQFIRLEVLLFSSSHSVLMRLTPIILLGACLLYSYMAGMGVAVQRSGLMLAMAILVSFSRYHWSLFDSWLWVMWMVLVINPLVSLFVGFWFSFAAVGSLLLAHAGIIRTFRNSIISGKIELLYRPQWIVFLTLLPLLWLFQQPASLFSVLLNMLAIPLLAFVILPLSLISFIAPDTLVLALFNSLLEFLLLSLNQLSQQTAWLIYKPSGLWIYALIPFVGFVLLFKGFPFKNVSLLIIVSVFFMPLKSDSDRFLVLDVGQGLAVYGQANSQLQLAEESNKTTNWLYDTGAQFRSGFSLGDAVAAKNILAMSGNQLDMLFISHSDNDHAGGEEGLRRKIQVDTTYAGQPKNAFHLECHRLDARWRSENGVKWRVFNVSDVSWSRENDNNASCVVQIEMLGRRILIPGDAELRIEKALIAQFGESLQSDILVVGHHGSKTSSSEAFIRAVDPEIAIISSGFNNPFRHPHQTVSDRFQRLGIALYNTATSGAVEVELSEKPTVIEWRLQNPPIWRQL